MSKSGYSIFTSRMRVIIDYYICMYVYKYSVDKYLLRMIKVRVR